MILVLLTLTYRKWPKKDSTKNDSDNIQSYCLTIITVSCYLYLCKLFLLFSQVSVESKGSWTLQNSILCLCFSKVVPDMGGKHFRRTAGSCKGVIVWLNYILHIQADLALPVAHSHIIFALNWSIFNFRFTNFQIAFFFSFTHYTAFVLMYLFHVQAKCI